MARAVYFRCHDVQHGHRRVSCFVRGFKEHASGGDDAEERLVNARFEGLVVADLSEVYDFSFDLLEIRDMIKGTIECAAQTLLDWLPNALSKDSKLVKGSSGMRFEGTLQDTPHTGRVVVTFDLRPCRADGSDAMAETTFSRVVGFMDGVFDLALGRFPKKSASADAPPSSQGQATGPQRQRSPVKRGVGGAKVVASKKRRR